MMHRTYYVAIISLSILVSACTGTADDYYTSGTGSAALNWDLPTQNTDDTDLDNLARLVIYYGPASGALAYRVSVEDPVATTYIVENLRQGITYMFAITAINTDGVESDFSNIVTRTIVE